MIGTVWHYMLVIGIITYASNRVKIHDFIDDILGMSAEQVQKADLKGKAKKVLEDYAKKKTQERGGNA